MKGTTIFFIILFIGLFMVIFSDFKTGLNNGYSDNQINASSWEGKYDKTVEVNSSVGKLKDKFDTITDTEKSWFTRISAGIVAIPYAVIIFPLAIFEGFTSFGGIVTDMGTELKIKASLISIALIILIVYAVKGLLEFFQRIPA